MLTEIEFELPAEQIELMGFPRLTQGQPLTVIFDAGILLPDPGANYWFAVQKEALPHRFVRVGRALYAFTGQIEDADIVKEEGIESATVLVNTGDVTFRATCAPGEDGRLPFGTWETRTITGLAHLQGIVEDDFATSIGRPTGVTIWQFRRLLLTPGDVRFGEWYLSAELPDSPYRFDRVLIEARLHRDRL
jgi:hypothetical protein